MKWHLMKHRELLKFLTYLLWSLRNKLLKKEEWKWDTLYVHAWTLEAARFCPLFFPLVRFDCRMARFPTQIKEVTGGHDHLFISKLEV